MVGPLYVAIVWALLPLAALAEDAEAIILRCKPARRPSAYGVITSLPSSEIRNCASIPVTDLLHSNTELHNIAVHNLSTSVDVVVVAQRLGPVFQLDVLSEGDRAGWDVTRPPSRAFRGQSCLNADMFCDVASVTPVHGGFLVLDRHRMLQFNFSWDQAAETLLTVLGPFNNIPNTSDHSNLLFPTAAAEYRPFNNTFVDSETPMTPVVPHANNRFLFLTDTGNHRVVMLNATGPQQMDVLGQFGVTQEPGAGMGHLNWPDGIAVRVPAVEAWFDAVFANVFVADRENDRLVKLNVGYPWTSSGMGPATRNLSAPRLFYGGEYPTRGVQVAYNETLNEPAAVALFRQYILVAEAGGNSISILTPHQANFQELVFVTRLFPASGLRLSGHLAVSGFGYAWYTYTKLPNNFSVGSFFLDEGIRVSPQAELIDDIIAQCQNTTWYERTLINNVTLFTQYMGYLLSASKINWQYPEMANYFDMMRFNVSGLFDLTLLNLTVFRGQMQICLPPPPSTTPPMLSGGVGGWTNSQSPKAKQGGAPRGAAPRFVACVLVVAAGTLFGPRATSVT